MRRAGRAVLALTVLGSAAGHAQEGYPRVAIGGRLQSQFYAADNRSHVDSTGPVSGFLVRRARLEILAALTDRVSLVLEPAFEGDEGARLRDAYVDLLVTPAAARTVVRLRVGQDKRPFSRHELMSSALLPAIERGAGRGLVELATNNLFDRARILSLDVGASVLVEHGGRTGYSAEVGVYNGEGQNVVRDANDAKSFGGRATVRRGRYASIGAGFFSHEGIPPGGSATVRHAAFGLDAQWGAPGEPGPFVLAEYLSGRDFGSTSRRLTGATVIGAFHVRLPTGSAFHALEPVARFDRADPDADGQADASTLVSGGVTLYVTAKAQIRAMLEHQSFATAELEPITAIRTAVTLDF